MTNNKKQNRDTDNFIISQLNVKNLKNPYKTQKSSQPKVKVISN